MLIFAIESSCDETSAAVVENGRVVLSNVISSQIGLHRKTGGVVPEVAARQHVLNIIPVIEKALDLAKVSFENISAIAVTEKPGLVGCVLVGLNTAQTLACIYNKPLIKVNHIYGHVYANWLIKGKRTKKKEDEFEFPIVVLSVSGGHNDIILMREEKGANLNSRVQDSRVQDSRVQDSRVQDSHIQILGRTLDDAAGEAFDKVARMIGLDYPGGPSIQKAAVNGNPKAFNFPRSMMKNQDFNFSFAGIKTAVLYTLRDLNVNEKNISLKLQADIAASFQEAVSDVLISKLLKAAEKYQAKEVHLTGGVSANLRLREILQERLSNQNYKIRWPSDISFCTDNAAMIGAAGYFVNK
ncbi:hypothetical protein A2335_03970 [Candidatus Peregrinibacteria bacterium RIFOXYB2_FULL_32_7]|nr:MAG: hypothetical protein A2335_03970 [Candidatus Peregrinibacteria bacterium RIFOXYB2_FULL_32_7]